jgi:hypothetical protein
MDGLDDVGRIAIRIQMARVLGQAFRLFPLRSSSGPVTPPPGEASDAPASFSDGINPFTCASISMGARYSPDGSYQSDLVRSGILVKVTCAVRRA